MGLALCLQQNKIITCIQGNRIFLTWTITYQFRDYLYYAPSFQVFSDNNPLTYILTSARLNALNHRWISELADYIFSIRYKPGEQGPLAQLVTRLIADPGVFSLIPTQSYILLEIDHEIISIVILLPMLFQERVLSVTSESMCTKYWLTAHCG